MERRASVLYRIPSRTAVHCKDVLDWLVKNDLVIYQADKYQIAKREFMDISRRKALEKKETLQNLPTEGRKVRNIRI